MLVLVKEYDKVKLRTGEIARICEVLEDNVAYIAEVFKVGSGNDCGISVEFVDYKDILSVFKEVEHVLQQAG